MSVTTKESEGSSSGVVWPAEFVERDADLELRRLPGFVTDELISLQDVRATLARVGRSPQVGPNLRVAVDGGYRQDFRQRLIDTGLPEGDSLADWAHRLFDDRRFYVVVNELEVFNPVLVRRVARALWPLVESQSRWFGGLSMALLIGREGFTSFGVHRDTDCRWNIQFHLGPAPKTMMVWPDGALDDASPADLLSVDPVSSRGKSFALDPGDLFVLPCRKQHAAHYTDLAVTLVASMKLQSERSLAEAAFRRLLESRAKGSSPHPVALGRSLSGSTSVRDLALDGAALEAAVEDERLRRWSNLGMAVRDAERLPRAAELVGKTVAIADPFPICEKILDDGRRWIAARGHTLTIASGEAVATLVARLNAGEHIEVGNDLPLPALMLLTFLAGHKAVCEIKTT